MENPDNFLVEKRSITTKEYQQLRATTDWNSLSNEVVESALANDLFSVCVSNQDQLIGMARVIGDGGIYFYIQDVIVHPEFQNRGIGRQLMNEVEIFLQANAPHNAFIGLMAAEGVAPFYVQYEYMKRPESRPGMYKVVSK